MNWVDVLSWGLLLGGSVFCITGAIGLLRLPDFYTRMHGAGVIDTLGAGLILIGLMFQAGLSLITVKLLFILFFIFITSPTATHAIAHAAHDRGLEPVTGTEGGDA